MSKKRKMMIGVAVVFFMITTVLMVIQPVKASGYIPSSSLTFDELNKTVDVSPNGNGTVIFYGVLNSSSVFRATVIFEVSMNGNETSDWNVSISPQSVNVWYGNQSTLVNVSVIVPRDTGNSIIGNINVTVTWISWSTGGPSVKIYQNLSVTVKPYYDLSISCLDANKETTSGNNLTFDLEAHNSGNTNETISWLVENEDELNSNGITTNFVFQELVIENNSVGYNTILVNVSKQTKSNTYKIRVYVSSENVSDYLNLTLMVKNAENMREKSEKPALIPDIGTVGIIMVLGGYATFIALGKAHLIRRRKR